MKAGRQFDVTIASEVMEFSLSQKKKEIFETTAKGSRPVPPYSTEIRAAWEVAEKMGISLIPIEGGGWFALVGSGKGWKSPSDFLSFIESTDFASAGAAVSEEAPMAICVAALKAVQSRRANGVQSQDFSPVTH